MKLFQGLLICSQVLSGQSWVRLSDFPAEKRDDGVAVIVGEKAYVGTGLKEGWTACRDFYAWDFTASAWFAVAEMPFGAERQYACAFSDPGGFFVFGGDNYGPLNDLYYFDIAVNAWTKKSPKPGSGLSGAVALSFGNEVIVCGGRNKAGEVSAEAWLYSISGDKWTRMPDVPFGGRWRASGTVLGGVGYLAGGVDSKGAYRRELYSFHPLTGQWIFRDKLPGNGRAYTTLRTTGRGSLLLFGGQDTTGRFYSDLWEFDPEESAWSRLADLPAAGRRGDMSCTWNNTFFYSCGLAEGDTRQNETWAIAVPGEAQEEARSTVFPNPTDDKVYIKLPAGADPNEVSCSVWAQHVNLNRSPATEFGHLVFDVTDLPAAVYIFIVEWPGSREAHKVIRK